MYRRVTERRRSAQRNFERHGLCHERSRVFFLAQQHRRSGIETPTITSATCCMESNRACSSFNQPPRNHCPTHHKSASTGLTPIAKARSSKSDLRCAVANHARFVKRQTPGTHAHGQRFCRPLHPARTLCLIVSTSLLLSHPPLAFNCHRHISVGSNRLQNSCTTQEDFCCPTPNTLRPTGPCRRFCMPC